MSMYMTILLEDGEYAALPREMDSSGELVYGNAAVYYLDRLAELSSDLGLRDLQSFIVDDPEDEAEAREYLGVDGGAERSAGVPGEWHAPAEALQTVRGLIDRVKATPLSAAPDFDGNRDAILWDLRAYEKILEGAREKGLRFQFSAG